MSNVRRLKQQDPRILMHETVTPVASPTSVRPHDGRLSHEAADLLLVNIRVKP